MQSFLGYRRLGQAVQKQIGNDEEKPPVHPELASDTSSEGERPQKEAEESPEEEAFDRLRSNQAGSISSEAPVEDEALNHFHQSLSAERVTTHEAERNTLGHALDGVDARYRATHEGMGGRVFVVGWNGEDHPHKPHSFGAFKKARMVLTVGFVGLVITMASSIDSAVLPQAAQEFGVSDVVESLATANYLIGFGLGTLLAGPLSETYGRNPVYLGLAPNIGAQITFRFLAGLSGSPILTLSGGTSLIAGGFMLAVVVLFQPEPYGPIILKWRAQHLRKITGDSRFLSETEIIHQTFFTKIKVALARPFVLVELIVALMTLHFAVLYIVLFVGYPSIFGDVYGISQGLTFTIFAAMLVGILLGSLLVPILYFWTKKHLEQRQGEGKAGIAPEQRLWFAMIGGSLSLPVSLFWMAWTNVARISIWSPIIASTIFGYGAISIFLCGYMYIIDSYEIYAASALTFVALVRYLAAGGMTVVGIPFYGNLGPQYTLTIMACIAAALTPIPYVLYIWGPKVRQFSKYAAHKGD
ncbi:MFS general substrate transporter [Rhizodiscina lignyota]|uniref:MFS general substrate transporter n=1 Tax=Rhizodiscina lignyota TaxID=1504668 RepID=A0A9P4IBC1_9PEZI|nr:MFS general substrate transporter [Rhizodiscina lignyota]